MTFRDPYTYPGTDVLVNKLNIRDEEELAKAEAEFVSYRISCLSEKEKVGSYDFRRFLKIHHYLFSDLYDWAGEPRRINITKSEAVLQGWSVEYADVFDIPREASRIIERMNARCWKQLEVKQRAKLYANDIADLWRVHCFREGNTRTISVFSECYAFSQGMILDSGLFDRHRQYFRDALVAYNAYFSDGTDVSRKEYLERIFVEAMK